MGKWAPKSPAPHAQPTTPQDKHTDAFPMSFIVRITRHKDADATYGGWVEEATSGEKASFLGFDELRAVISRFLSG